MGVTVEVPETRYTRTVDGVNIAYQLVGEGPLNFVLVNSVFFSNVEVAWTWELSDQLRWMAARGRLALFDRRGSGLSDPVNGERRPTIEARADDIRAVMDAAGFERAILVGMEDGAAQCFMFAATFPERTTAIITFAAASRGSWAPDSPWAWTEHDWDQHIEAIGENWGTPGFTQLWTQDVFPTKAEDSAFMRSYGHVLRQALSRQSAQLSEQMYAETDVRPLLPLIQAPTLVVHATEDRLEPVEEARYIAAHVPGARLLEFPGPDHFPWFVPEAVRVTTQGVDQFLSQLHDEQADFERVLSTMLFTDVVGSTERAVELGDRAYGGLIEQHHTAVRSLLGRFRGREVDTAGDGFFVTFDGPARAVRCAHAIVSATHSLGVDVRCGVHTGEVEVMNGKVGGIAVNIAARVAHLASASEVLVSSTVKDLVAGSGLQFDFAGEHVLKGVPDSWRLFRLSLPA
jgi:pimeloyl-ACP methyl ester carboxylesterase/class 3 adenylate cyclase